jgi:host factor-I protein
MRQCDVAVDHPLCYLWVQVGHVDPTEPPAQTERRRSIKISKGWHPVEAVNRKLIRPSLNEIKEQIAPPRRPPAAQKKPVPPDQTNAENFYYVKQMQAKTAMVFVLRDGETLHGTIEWYDKCCLKVNRTEGPNLLLYKPSIKYMYKEG